MKKIEVLLTVLAVFVLALSVPAVLNAEADGLCEAYVQGPGFQFVCNPDGCSPCNNLSHTEGTSTHYYCGCVSSESACCHLVAIVDSNFPTVHYAHVGGCDDPSNGCNKEGDCTLVWEFEGGAFSRIFAICDGN